MNELTFFKPVTVFSHKVRLGQNLDGGYIVNNLILNNSASLFSYGCGGDMGFETDFTKITKKASYIFDHTIGWESFERDGLIFTPEGLGFSDKCKTFFDHYNERNISDKVLLKIDVEGYEYEYFSSIDISLLKSIVSGIVIEVHWIQDDTNREKLLKILTSLYNDFYLFHIHGNNWGGEWEYNGFKVPRVVEMSLVNKELVEHVSFEPEKYPIPNLDYPNNTNLDDCDLSFITK